VENPFFPPKKPCAPGPSDLGRALPGPSLAPTSATPAAWTSRSRTRPWCRGSNRHPTCNRQKGKWFWLFVYLFVSIWTSCICIDQLTKSVLGWVLEITVTTVIMIGFAWFSCRTCTCHFVVSTRLLTISIVHTLRSCSSGCCQDLSWAVRYLEGPGSHAKDAISVQLLLDNLLLLRLHDATDLALKQTKCLLEESWTFHGNLTLPILPNNRVPHSIWLQTWSSSIFRMKIAICQGRECIFRRIRTNNNNLADVSKAAGKSCLLHVLMPQDLSLVIPRYGFIMGLFRKGVL
jgi:hypothetical protein